jgi:hypothetical protein
LALPEFVEHFCGSTVGGVVEAAMSEAKSILIVAVDAPLGYPTAFREFVSNSSSRLATWSDKNNPSGRFIDNPLAFRLTDREIATLFPGKSPLSVSFDKLGNPASVAIRYTRHWANGESPIVQKNKPVARGLPHIIEVYPALAKTTASRKAPARPPYSAVMGECLPGSHLYDARLSAVIALGLALGDDVSLPTIEPTESQEGEGAIWYPSNLDWRLAG